MRAAEGDAGRADGGDLGDLEDEVMAALRGGGAPAARAFAAAYLASSKEALHGTSNEAVPEAPPRALDRLAGASHATVREAAAIPPASAATSRGAVPEPPVATPPLVPTDPTPSAEPGPARAIDAPSYLLTSAAPPVDPPARAPDFAPTALLPEGLPIPAHLRLPQETGAPTPAPIPTKPQDLPAGPPARAPLPPFGETRLTPATPTSKPLPFTPFVPAPPSPAIAIRAKDPLPRVTAAPTSDGAPSTPFRAAPSGARPDVLGSGTRWLPDSQRGATVAPSGPRGPALPFGASPVAVSPDEIDLSMFPIERYAEIVARLSRGEPREAVLRGAVLNEPMWLAIQQAWGRLLKNDKALADRFNDLLSRGLGGTTKR